MTQKYLPGWPKYGLPLYHEGRTKTVPGSFGRSHQAKAFLRDPEFIKTELYAAAQAVRNQIK